MTFAGNSGTRQCAAFDSQEINIVETFDFPTLEIGECIEYSYSIRVKKSTDTMSILLLVAGEDAPEPIILDGENAYATKEQCENAILQ